MQIAICDDERKIRELLGEKVQKIYPQAELQFCATGEELLALEHQPDILFLDIQMPGRNGMEIAKELRKRGEDSVLIFVTAIEEYVFQAFDVGAFHFLVKPFTDEKFHEILENAVNQLNNRNALDEDMEKYMMIKSGGNRMKVLLNDIVYAEVFNRKIIIHMEDGDVIYYGRMSELEKTLGEDFFRPHRAYLIHFKYVTKYNGSTITMKDKTVLLAKAKFPEFVQKYLKYNQRKGQQML